MQPVDQSTVTPTEGDCMRAVVASLFDLPLDAVPHFMRFNEKDWWRVYLGFFWALGWEVGEWKTEGEIDPDSGIDGFFDAAVPSKTFPSSKHAVVIDSRGVVVHDPNPNKLWLGVNVLESGDLVGYYTMRRIDT